MKIAAHFGHFEVVKILLEQGANKETADLDEWIPLHSAAVSGHFEVVKILLQKGTNMEAPNEERSTPLNIAAHFGEFEGSRYS